MNLENKMNDKWLLGDYVYNSIKYEVNHESCHKFLCHNVLNKTCSVSFEVYFTILKKKKRKTYHLLRLCFMFSNSINIAK